MREIKFRIYFEADEDEPAWMSEPITLLDLLHGEDIEFRDKEDIVSLPLNDFRFFYKPNERYKLMQYAGLKDKNGKEIYEGDIVRFEDIGEDGYEYKEGFDFENEAQVIYEDGQVTLTNFGEGDNSHYANDGQPDILDEILRNGNCEVIGNIYENPELLKEN